MNRYRVTIKDKVYEVEVERGEARIYGEYKVSALHSSGQDEKSGKEPVPSDLASRHAPEAVSKEKAGGEAVTAPMPGKILEISVSRGQMVRQGQVAAVLEAMKMENEILAPCSGRVARICAEKGAFVETGQEILIIDGEK